MGPRCELIAAGTKAMGAHQRARRYFSTALRVAVGMQRSVDGMIDLLNLRQLLRHAFSESEATVRREAGLWLPNAQETEITACFVLEVGRRLEAASNEGS